MDNISDVKNDLVQAIRLAINEQTEDVRLFAARLVRKYRKEDAQLAEQLNIFLRNRSARNFNALRKHTQEPITEVTLPIDEESRLPLLKVFNDKPESVQPLLTKEVDETIGQLIQERLQIERLASAGLRPARSAIFLGKPGVGKTLTARWVAGLLGLPLYILDLTAVMSSLLGKTGANIRMALDFAKSTDCVLLLDEVDAIAKRRSDDADVGELKRLVTVILQEVDDWPSSSLLLAATNYAELIDPAIWRRFDLVVNFQMPDARQTKLAIIKFLDNDVEKFERWVNVLAICLSCDSYSDIERSVYRFRRSIALEMASEEEAICSLIVSRGHSKCRQDKIKVAISLAKETTLSQHTISDITGVSRDTIRKHLSTMS